MNLHWMLIVVFTSFCEANNISVVNVTHHFREELKMLIMHLQASTFIFYF